MSTALMTTVRLLSGVPFDRNNTINFASAQAQATYMSGKAALSASELSYQREQKYIAYPAEYDRIINCNYLMYQNASYGGKWFYAFITNVEYVNDETTYVYFEIDPWQTFLFDVTVKSCLVEREHVADDSVGANLIEEGLALGDYVANEVIETNFNSWWIVVGSTVDLKDTTEFPPVGGYMYGGIYSGTSYYIFDPSDIDILEAVITGLGALGKLDAIVTMYMTPKDAVQGGSSGGFLPSTAKAATTMEIPNSSSIDGYTPRNNKLLTYPYRALQISNNDGNAVILRYEFFANNVATVAYVATSTPNGRIICYPQSYKGVIRNFNESIALGNFPQCTWVKDVYANWLASQSIRWGYQRERLFVNNMVDVVKGAAGALSTGNISAMAGPTINNLTSSYNLASSIREEKEVHSIIPNAVGGSIGDGYTNVTFNKYAFTAEQKSIKAEIARCIDEYFDVFGYKVNRVKVPNMTGRPSWNYVKTVNAIIIGKAPQPYIEEMKAAMNAGITFWHGDWVGDYSRANK